MAQFQPSRLAESHRGGRVAQEQPPGIAEASVAQATHELQVAAGGAGGRRGEATIQARGVAAGPDEAGRIVLEGGIMQGPDQGAVEIRDTGEGVEQRTRLEAGSVGWRHGQDEGHGVDGEVTTGEVFIDSGWFHLWQSAGAFVMFAPGPGEVNATAAQLQRGGAEVLVGMMRGAEPSGHDGGQGEGIAVEGNVDVDSGADGGLCVGVGSLVGTAGRGVLAQEVADGATDEVTRYPSRLRLGHNGFE